MRTGPQHIVGICTALIAVGAATLAWPHSLTVPKFRDDGDVIVNGTAGSGAAALVAIRNTTAESLTVYIVYTQADNQGQAAPQAAVPFTLLPKQQVTWRPAQDDPVEGAGRSVPNVLTGSPPEGSIDIIWIGGPERETAVVGRYVELSSRNAMAHVLR